MFKNPIILKYPSLFSLIFTLILLLSSSSCAGKGSSESGEKDTLLVTQPDTLRLLFVGDLMFHRPQLKAAANAAGGKGYDFMPVFEAIRPYLERNDISFGNLETTCSGQPYRGYPCFSSPDTIVPQLAALGFDVLTTANNHALDYGAKGLVRTLSLLKRYGLKTTGTFLNAEDRRDRSPLLLDTLGFRIAILAYTYGSNGLTVKPPYELSRIDTLKMKQEILHSLSLKPDLLIAIMHWGDEYANKASLSQKKLDAWLHRQGVNAVIGSHPHVVQEVEFRKDSLGALHPTIFSLGNFVSNQSSPYTQHGLLAEMTIVKQKDQTQIRELQIIPTFCYRQAKASNRYRVVPIADEAKYKDLLPLYERQQAESRMKRFYQELIARYLPKD